MLSYGVDPVSSYQKVCSPNSLVGDRTGQDSSCQSVITTQASETGCVPCLAIVFTLPKPFTWMVLDICRSSNEVLGRDNEAVSVLRPDGTFIKYRHLWTWVSDKNVARETYRTKIVTRVHLHCHVILACA